MAKVKLEYSAGGVVVDKDNNVLVIRTRNLQDKTVWGFPKGHIEKDVNETSEGAAVREVEEETGYRCSIVKSVESVQYFFREHGQLIKKNVQWYLMSPVSQVTEGPTGTSHRDTGNPEVDEVKWFAPEEAINILSYDTDREMVKKWVMNR